MNSLNPILRVRALSKSYSRGMPGCEATHVVLRNLNLDVYAGECVVLLGPPGAGKTTLLYCLAGMLKPTSGDVDWYVSTHPANAATDIAFISEQAAYYGFLTVAESLEYYVVGENLNRVQRRKQIERALDITGLELASSYRVDTLSASALRRLRLAQAIAGSPKIILLDELITNIHINALNHFRSILKRLASDGVTIIATTHLEHVAAQLATRVVRLTPTRNRSGLVLHPHPLTSRIQPPVS